MNDDNSHSFNEELHIATALNHVQEAKKILSQNHNLVNEIDVNNGDQPLHIAARSGSVEMTELLIEYDAPIGRRNYEGLTPHGVARFHNQQEIVGLLNRFYKLIEDYEGEEPERCKYERIDLESIPSQILVRQVEHEKRVQQAQIDWLDWWSRKKENESASLIQKVYITRKNRIRVKLEYNSSIKIQQKWKTYKHNKEQRAATKIQSFQRMISTKSYFVSFQRERMYWHRASRILSSYAQKLWRGYKGRAIFRRTRAMRLLPDPSDAFAHDAWVKLQQESSPPCRTWNMYSEFVLGKKPRSWADRRVKRNGHFRDVVFWVNNLTQHASWTQPPKWKQLDSRECKMRIQVLQLGYTISQHHTASKLQALWRARIARRNLSLILRARRVVEKAIETYYLEPQNTVALCNYTLHVHVVQENTEQALDLYESCLNRMKEKGNDNAFILYGYAILRASIGLLDFETFAARAQSAEEGFFKRNKTKRSLYILANEIFRLTAIDKQTGSSWHNYALCRMIAFRDLKGAKLAFLKAMVLCPSDSILIKNFNKLLNDNSSDSDALDEFRIFKNSY